MRQVSDLKSAEMKGDIKMKFTAPQMEVISFNDEDIITASGTTEESTTEEVTTKAPNTLEEDSIL